MVEKIKQFLKADNTKAVKTVVLIGLIALVGIFLSESFSTKKSAKTEVSESTHEVLKAYEKETETRLQNILSDIEGVGACTVMVTSESGSENVYSADKERSEDVSEQKRNIDEKSKHLIVDDGGESPVLEKEMEPKLRGVIVVCEGADNVNVRQAVTDCVKAVLGISGANISVVKGGHNG